MLSVNGNVNAMPRKISCKLEISGNTITNIKMLTYASDWSGDLTIGQVVSSYITATIPTPAFSLVSANVSHSMGIGSPVEWVAVGQYHVDESSIRTRMGYTSFTAYDKLHDALNTYHSQLTFPATLQAICDEVCAQIDITSTTLNVSFTVNEDTLSGYTLRDVLGFIAGMCGKNAYLSANNQLELRWFSASGYTADDTRANVPYIGENDCTVNRLICQTSDGVLTSGTGEGIFFTCPLITQARLDAIQGTLAGFTYRKAEVDIPYGNFCLQSGDIITVSTTGTNLTVPIMANSWTYDGGLSSTVSAYGVSDYNGTANNAERPITAQRVQSTLDAKRIAKRQQSVFESELQHATELITGASGGHIRINFDGTTGQPAEILIMDTTDINTARNIWVANLNGWGHFSNGYGVGNMNIALTADGHVAADRIAGNKISGVKIENFPASVGQQPHIMIENGSYTINQVTVVDGVVTSTTPIGRITFLKRDAQDTLNKLAIQADESTGTAVTIGSLNAEEFVYYSDMSIAPSGAGKFNFSGGDIHVQGDIQFLSNGVQTSLEALEQRVAALEARV